MKIVSGFRTQFFTRRLKNIHDNSLSEEYTEELRTLIKGRWKEIWGIVIARAEKDAQLVQKEF
jgi:hypothetical protein